MRLTHGNHDGHRNQAAGAPVQTGTSPDIRKDLVDRVGSDRAPKVFESAEALSFEAAWSPIISRTTLIPASLFVMIESSCKAQVTSPPQYYPNGSRTHTISTVNALVFTNIASTPEQTATLKLALAAMSMNG